MKRISRYRRHKAAAPLLLFFALLTVGATFSVASATTSAETTSADRSVQIEEGRQIFLKGCSSSSWIHRFTTVNASMGRVLALQGLHRAGTFVARSRYKSRRA